MQVQKLSKNEVLMVNIGSLSTGGRVLAVKADLAKIVLTQPVCTEIGEKIALSRRVEKHWRYVLITCVTYVTSVQTKFVCHAPFLESFGVRLASHAEDVPWLVTRSFPRGERVTSLRTSAWEAAWEARARPGLAQVTNLKLYLRVAWNVMITWRRAVSYKLAIIAAWWWLSLFWFQSPLKKFQGNWDPPRRVQGCWRPNKLWSETKMLQQENFVVFSYKFLVIRQTKVAVVFVQRMENPSWECYRMIPVSPHGEFAHTEFVHLNSF